MKNKIVLLTVVLSIVIFDLLALIGLSKYLFKLDNSIISGMFGSIIGGFLTLIGVKWTIKENYRLANTGKLEKTNYVI